MITREGTNISTFTMFLNDCELLLCYLWTTFDKDGRNPVHCVIQYIRYIRSIWRLSIQKKYKNSSTKW